MTAVARTASTLAHRLRAHPAVRRGGALLGALVVALAVLPAVLPHAPYEQLDLGSLTLRPPSRAHPLGTDHVARDVLARVVEGGRTSLLVATGAVLLGTGLGTLVGVAAGLGGRTTDGLTMRAVDAGLAIPRVLLLLVVLAAVPQPPLALLIVALGATGWFAVARLVRGEVRRLRDADFVLAARALGAGRWAIARRHILPHIAGPVLVTAALGVGQVIVLEAGLSWLGIGVQPPQASWGNIIRDGTDVLASAPWLSLAPGVCLVLVVLACSLLADGLRDALDGREVPRA